MKFDDKGTMTIKELIESLKNLKDRNQIDENTLVYWFADGGHDQIGSAHLRKDSTGFYITLEIERISQ